MLVPNIAALLFVKTPALAMWIFQENAAVGFDIVHLFKQMSALAIVIVAILFIMSAWSIGVMIDRFFYFNADHEPGSRLYLTGIKDAASGQDYFYYELPLLPQ